MPFRRRRPLALGWLSGHPKDYDRAHALDVPQLFQFLHATRPETVKKLADMVFAMTSEGFRGVAQFNVTGAPFPESVSARAEAQPRRLPCSRSESNPETRPGSNRR
jgi:hypothetical protein